MFWVKYRIPIQQPKKGRALGELRGRDSGETGAPKRGDPRETGVQRHDLSRDEFTSSGSFGAPGEGDQVKRGKERKESDGDQSEKERMDIYDVIVNSMIFSKKDGLEEATPPKSECFKRETSPNEIRLANLNFTDS